jgi:hypothetical protein
MRGRRPEVGALRAVATRLGYLLGALLGGVALATGDHAPVGAVFAGLFGVAARPHLCVTRRRCTGRAG